MVKRMMMMMKKLLPILPLLACLVALSLGATAEKGAKPENCNRSTFDNCALTMAAFGDENLQWPVNMKEMNQRCKDIKTTEKCTKDYASKCMATTAKQSVSVILFGVAKTNKFYCSNVKRKNAFVSFGACANSVKGKWAKVLEAANREFHGATTYSDVKMRIPLMCCIYHKYRQKVHDAMAGEGAGSLCTAEVIEEADKVIEGYGRDGINLLCGEYTDDSDKCQSVINKVPKFSKPLRSKAFILGISDLLESI